MLKRGMDLLAAVILLVSCIQHRVPTVENKALAFQTYVHEALHLLGMELVDIEIQVVEDDYQIDPFGDIDAGIFEIRGREKPTFIIQIKQRLLNNYDNEMLRHVATHETCHAYLTVLGPGINHELNAERCVYLTLGEKHFVEMYMKLWQEHPEYKDMSYNELRAILIPALQM